MLFRSGFSYDPTVSFDAANTTLLCDLLPAGATPNCPTMAAGQGTVFFPDLATINEEDFSVNQTGLTITPDASGLSSVTVGFTPTAPIAAAPGDRNFLALAFDLLVPLEDRTIVTYSPNPLRDFSLLTTACTYSREGIAGSTDCSSAHPSLSMRISTAPAPGPLALGGLPAMALAARRLRKRLRCSLSR